MCCCYGCVMGAMRLPQRALLVSVQKVTGQNWCTDTVEAPTQAIICGRLLKKENKQKKEVSSVAIHWQFISDTELAGAVYRKLPKTGHTAPEGSTCNRTC